MGINMNFNIEEISKLEIPQIEKELERVFLDLYGNDDDANCDNDVLVFRTPYVITIAGEQIAYNGGCVLMSKINKHFFLAIRKTNSTKITYTDMNSQHSYEFTIEKNEHKDIKVQILFNMIAEFNERNYKIDSGFEILSFSTVGIDTLNHANFEATSAVAISSLFQFSTDLKELAEISAQSEKRVLNTKYGAAEHFCILNVKEKNAIWLDTRYYKYDCFNFDLGDYEIILLGNNRKRESICNVRRVECEEGLRVLRKKIDIDNLCEITKADYDYYKINFFDKTIKRRVKHCVSENARVTKAFDILKAKEVDVDSLGKIFAETHISLRDNFELVSEEQNALFESAIIQSGCRGAKMTGYDFYDINLAIVRKDKIEEFTKEVKLAYSDKTETELLVVSRL